ncbi:MAG: hypothetical protein J0H57_06550, partial [Rhodospirillales bacterium]|nr:hypothetical protein [Rhodospirillales bacterium]
MRITIILAACVAAVALAPHRGMAQATITENINNTGLPSIPRNAPALGLSNIYGLNPCATGSSVGVTTPLFGLGGAISDIDRECETRNNAAVVITGLKDEALAREILCEIKDVRQAAIRVGRPCLQDQRTAAAGGPPVASAAPAPGPVLAASAAPTPVIATPLPPPAATPVLQPGAPVRVAPPPATQEADAAPATTVVAGAPAFCRTPWLQVSLYPECTTAPSAAPAPKPVAQSRPAPRSVTRAAPPAVEPASAPAPHPPVPPAATTVTAAIPGCNIPSALLAMY